MEFSRQKYWSGLPLPTPGDLPDPRIEPSSPASLVLAGGFFPLHHLGRPLDKVLIFSPRGSKEPLKFVEQDSDTIEGIWGKLCLSEIDFPS